jgi:hypothetical protein
MFFTIVLPNSVVIEIEVDHRANGQAVGGNNQKHQQSATRWDDRKYMYFAPNNITSLTKVNVVDG